MTFTKVGIYHYVCLIHPGMDGTITVLPRDRKRAPAGAMPASLPPLTLPMFGTYTLSVTSMDSRVRMAGQVIVELKLP